MSSKNTAQQAIENDKYHNEKYKSLFLVSIAGYFAELYTRYFYNNAYIMKTNKEVKFITEGYKHVAWRFMQVMSNDPKLYIKTVMDINDWYSKDNKFSKLSLTDFIDIFVKEFTPSDFFSALNKDQKRQIMKRVLVNSIAFFTRHIMKNHLCDIIDNHDNAENATVLRDLMLDILLHERESMFHTFMYNAGGENEKKEDDIMRMQRELKGFAKEKADLQDEIKKYKGVIQEMTEGLDDIQQKSQKTIKMAKYYKELYEAEKENNNQTSIKLTAALAAAATQNISAANQNISFSKERSAPVKTSLAHAVTHNLSESQEDAKPFRETEKIPVFSIAETKSSNKLPGHHNQHNQQVEENDEFGSETEFSAEDDWKDLEKNKESRVAPYQSNKKSVSLQENMPQENMPQENMQDQENVPQNMQDQEDAPDEEENPFMKIRTELGRGPSLEDMY